MTLSRRDEFALLVFETLAKKADAPEAMRLGKVTRHDPELEYIGSGEYIPAMHKSPDGDFVLHSDHAREFTRLQTARARNLVRAMTARKLLVWNEDWVSPTEHRRPRLVNWLEIVADRIEAKYLRGEK